MTPRPAAIIHTEARRRDDDEPSGGAETDERRPTQPGYAAALHELDGILRELEGSDVDVDRLADHVARAAELIAFCRDRIGAARLQIDEVVADLDGDADPADQTAA